MVTKILLLGVLLSSSGCDTATFDNPMRKVVREKLKDPDSAKWGESYTYKSRACLEVNSKNSYGGYTGKQIAWLHTYDSGESWSVDRIEEGVCFETPLKELAEIDDKEKAAETKMLALLESKGYKVTSFELITLKGEDPSVDKCLLRAKDALTAKRISLKTKGDEQVAWERRYEKGTESIISGACKG
jgi:hypothetical protein